VYTVVETPLFQRLADDYWTEEELSAFISFIAANPPDQGGNRTWLSLPKESGSLPPVMSLERSCFSRFAK